MVVYDDDDMVVIDKPVGVAAHPSPGWNGPTVIGGLAGAGYRVSTSGAAERQGIVHRLDVGTSGLMVVAKSERAYTALKRAFKERTVEKVYHALVQGHLDPSRGTVDAPIDRHPVHDWRWAVVAGGKPSVTHYETLEAFRAGSLLEIHLETGRTHQIRVHLSALRHPCVGDITYGADPALGRLGLERQWLHARTAGLRAPVVGGVGQLHLRLPGRPHPCPRRHPVRVMSEVTVSVVTDPALVAEAYALRYEVFVVEQGVPVELERDERDPEADHVLAGSTVERSARVGSSSSRPVSRGSTGPSVPWATWVGWLCSPVPVVAGWAPPSCARSRNAPASAGCVASTSAPRPTPSPSTNGSATRPTARSSATPACRTATCRRRRPSDAPRPVTARRTRDSSIASGGRE